MKNLFTIFSIFAAIHLNAQVGIGTTTPDVSSQLEIASTTKGILIPRMTLAQRTAYSNSGFRVVSLSNRWHSGILCIQNFFVVIGT